jgi:hypothetical protein
MDKGFNCKLSKRFYNTEKGEYWKEATVSGTVVGGKIYVTWTCDGEVTKYTLKLSGNGKPVFNKP